MNTNTSLKYKLVDSYNYDGYYKIKPHLMDFYPWAFWFIVATSYKGIGKSYGVYHEIIPHTFGKSPIVLLSWTQDEKAMRIMDIKNDPNSFVNKSNLDCEWIKVTGIDICVEKSTRKYLLFALAASDITKAKGMATNENFGVTLYYWDEFISDLALYVKPKEKIDGLFQLIGSMSRDTNYQIIMTANNNGNDTVWSQHLFADLQWPEHGQTLLCEEIGLVIDNPNLSDYVKKRYTGSTLERMSRINPQIHRNLFGGASLLDGYYYNVANILPGIDVGTLPLIFSMQLGIDKYHVYQYKEYWYFIRVNMWGVKDIQYAATMRTAIETNRRIIPEYYLGYLQQRLENNKLRFKDSLTQQVIIDWILLNAPEIKETEWEL